MNTFDFEEIATKLLALFCQHEEKSLLTPKGTKLDNPPLYKVYFSGEFDSNQTKFEKKSNHLEIAVVARNIYCASILLALLRSIIDGEGSMRHIFESSSDWNEFLKDVLDQEKDNLTEYPLNMEVFETTLSYGSESTVVQKRLSQIDLWTCERIRENTC